MDNNRHLGVDMGKERELVVNGRGLWPPGLVFDIVWESMRPSIDLGGEGFASPPLASAWAGMGLKMMTDNVAVLAGFTEAVTADNEAHVLYLMVKPGTDFDSAFKAWDTDNQEWLTVNGWLFSIEPGHE